MRDRLAEHSRISAQTWVHIGKELLETKADAERDGPQIFAGLFAKSAAERGDLKRYPFSLATGRKLMSIAERFSTTGRNESLPSSLHELSRMPAMNLAKGFSLVVKRPDPESATLVRYDAMVRAIAECHRVDEVKEIHNKALALELYAKVAMDTDSERKATEVRLRAERRAGELLAKVARGNAGRPGKKAATVAANSSLARPVSGIGCGEFSTPDFLSPYQDSLKSAGLNERTARRWQELAAVPEWRFEDALRDPEKKPTTTGILVATKPAPKMDDDALWIWGRLRDFERMEIARRDAPQLFKAMTDTMQDDVRRIRPSALDFLGQLDAVGEGDLPALKDGDAEPRRARLSRAKRWAEAAQQAIGAIEQLVEMQQEFQNWRDNSPENFAGTALADKLDAVSDVDLQGAIEIVEEAANTDLPLGFGRD